MVKTVCGKSEVTTTQLEEASDQLLCPAYATVLAIYPSLLIGLAIFLKYWEANSKAYDVGKDRYNNLQWALRDVFLPFLNCWSSIILAISPSLFVRLGRIKQHWKAYSKSYRPRKPKSKFGSQNHGERLK